MVSDEEAYELVMQAVRRHFRPEFINRIDEIVMFHRLRKDQMGGIVEIQLKRLAKLLEDRKITLDLTPRRGPSSPTRAMTRPMAPAR